MEEFKLRPDDEYIQLTQLLKATNIAESGSMAKMLIDDELVKVDGEIEYRYRRKLYDGMIVEFEDKTIKVVK